MQKSADLQKTSVAINGEKLRLDQIEAVARKQALVSLSPEATQAIQHSEATVQNLLDVDEPIYGVNTGFGVFSQTKIKPSQIKDISRNLILSHAVAVGPPFPEEVTRAAMLIRANTLALGHSGVRLPVVEALIQMLNENVTPIIPSQGSLGSSGDLALLAHLVLVLADLSDENQSSESGEAIYQGIELTGREAMEAAGIERVELGPKEGLALTNGATFSAGLVALALMDAKRLMYATEIAAAMTYDALLGVPSALDARIHSVRRHPGQIEVASRMRNYVEGSTLIGSKSKIQDAYSLRCTPQIIGPSWEAIEFANEIISREVNAVTDNPLIFDSEVISGGNFHGQPVGMVADFLKIALSEVCNLSERRTYRLLAAHTNEGLHPMLISDAENIGLHSGLMMLQYTAASLCLENQTLASPSSTLSLPTSAGQEDHNANAATAARHLRSVVENMYAIVAIELICAAQALDLRLTEMPDRTAGRLVTNAWKCVRQVSPFVDQERPLGADIQSIINIMRNGALLEGVGLLEPML